MFVRCGADEAVGGLPRVLFVLAARCPRAVDVSVVELTEIFREKWQTNANVCTEKKNEDWPPTIKKVDQPFWG